MIKVVNAKIETPIFLSSERPHLLIIENPHEYYAAVTEMQRAIDGELSEFTFWESIAQLQPASGCPCPTTMPAVCISTTHSSTHAALSP